MLTNMELTVGLNGLDAARLPAVTIYNVGN
jgi:hypothetical protein